jgi:glutamate racemase
VLLEQFSIEIIVLACNTASVSAISELRAQFPAMLFVGTVPAIKTAVEKSRSAVVGVLGTERTIADPYIDDLAFRYGKNCRILKLAAPELVAFVEKKLHTAGAAEKRDTASLYVEQFRRGGADGIVLGCTHFLFLRDDFTAAANPDIGIYDSLEGVTGRVESLLPEKITGSGKGKIFIISGENEPEDFWIERAKEFGMELRLLNGVRW